MNEIFSILSSGRARTNVILAGKCGSGRQSATSVILAGKRGKTFSGECRGGGNKSAQPPSLAPSLKIMLTFLVKNCKMKLSGKRREKTSSQISS